MLEPIEEIKLNDEKVKMCSNWMIIIPEKQIKEFIHPRIRTIKDKECITCHTIFNYGLANKKYCDFCQLYVSCNICRKWHRKNYIYSSDIDAINNGTKIKSYCSLSCSGKATYDKSLGRILKEEPERYAKFASLGGLATAEWSKKNPELAYARNKLGGDKSAEYFNNNPELKYQRNVKAGLSTAEFYKKHPEVLMKNALNWQKGSVKKHLENPGDWNRNISKGLLKYYEDNPEARMLKYSYVKKYWDLHPERRILNLGDYKRRPLFNNKGKELTYLDKDTNEYVPWTKFKSMFKIQEIGCLGEFQQITTFRTQDSENWTGVRTAFEQQLLDLDIGYFVYVKYYIDENSEFNPLVIGQTASLNVNIAGTDVRFDYDNINGGPSRRFLVEEGYEWNKTQIGIIKTGSRAESLSLEKELQEKYKIFES